MNVTKEDFQNSEAYMSQLEEFLRTPSLNAALDITYKQALRELPQPVPGVDYAAQCAAHGAYITGWVKALEYLKGLAYKKQSISSKQVTQPDLYKDEAKRRLVESKLYTEQEAEEASSLLNQ